MIQSIFTRRSTRKFVEKKVSDEVVENALRAGMQAPSAGNVQPWEFVVIRNKESLNAIPNFHPYSAMLPSSDVAIVVCGDLAKEKHKGYWVQDCSACTQNILLALEEMGLGAVWLGVYPVEERVKNVQKLLALPENIVPLSIIAIGYKGEEKEPANRFNPEKIHFEKW